MTENKMKITKIMNDVMGIDITKLDGDRKVNTISEWDSFNNLMLISRLQEEFHVEFSATEIDNAQTINDIYTLVESKLK